MKREGELKRKLAQEIARQLGAYRFYVLQYSTNGAPDREIIGNGVSTRWEMKHATPDFKSPDDQELMCCRIAAVAHCRYIIWHERRGVQRTQIVHPLKVKNRISWDLEAEASCEGFDMRWLVRYIAQQHAEK